jgi:OH-DDVA oxygenase/3-O-methylgallate 3,4-dioxygenase
MDYCQRRELRSMAGPGTSTGIPMAKIVLGVWTTHGPQLNTTPEQWMLRLPADRARRHAYKGNTYSFDELTELRRDEPLAEKITLEARTARHLDCQTAIDEVARIWAEVRPDVCVIFGNDQRELVLPSMQPCFTIYHGDKFWNGPIPEQRLAGLAPGIRESEWANRPEQRVDYQGLPELARKLISTGLDSGWDFAASDAWPEHEPEHHHAGTPHAFAYILRRVMREHVVPTLPIVTNTFFPPNQPRPWRCFEMGKLVHQVVTEWDTNLRVAVFGSGGMTHFAINEEFDRALINAIAQRDEAFMRSVPPSYMKDGTSELLNWISAAGCLFQTTDLDGGLIAYVPCYRSLAGTGTAQGFITWT